MAEEASITSENYTVHDNVLTVCVLRLSNGVFAIGQSLAASESAFNSELGRQYAREDALRKLWATPA